MDAACREAIRFEGRSSVEGSGGGGGREGREGGVRQGKDEKGRWV